MNQNHLNTSLKDKVLQSLGLPEEGFEGKIRLLSPSENSIRLDILLFMAEGKIVNINDLTATEEQIDVQSALQRLRELDLIHWDQNSGDVNVAYPFQEFRLHTVLHWLECCQLIPCVRLMPLAFHRCLQMPLLNRNVHFAVKRLPSM